MVYTARSSRTWAGLLACLRKVSSCSPVVLCLVRSSGASGCPCPRWSSPALPSAFSLSCKLSFLACKFLAYTSVCLPPLRLASPILCLLNCNAPLGGVAQCWPSVARGLLLGDRYSGRYARAARAAAHPAAWLLIIVAIVIACVLAGPAQYCPRLLPCPASVLSWHASFLLVSRFALGDTARPRSRPLTCVPSSCLASHLFWAELLHYCLSLSRSSTPPRVPPDSTRVTAPVLVPEVPVVAAHATRTPPAPVATPDASLRGPSASSVTADLVGEAVDVPSLGQDAMEVAADRSTPDDAPYDPMVHTETSDMLEEALEIARDCVLLADLTGVIQANGEDLVNEAIPEAVGSIIRERKQLFGGDCSAVLP
ncbi:hypothetical protein V6N13_040306 [Hibiscus sabdariffa]